MIKKYRKKGTEKHTHKSWFDDYMSHYVFWEDKLDSLPKHFETQLELNQFLKENDYEEVMDSDELPKDRPPTATEIKDVVNKRCEGFYDFKPTFTGKVESKLHFAKKVDRALEKAKNELSFARLCHFTKIDKLQEVLENLVNAIEEEKLNYPNLDTLKPREPDKLDDKIAEFNKKNEGKFEPLKAEDLKVKEDVKLPNDDLKQSFEDYKNKENLTVCENMQEFKESVKLPEVGQSYKHKNDYETIVKIAYVKPRITLEDGSSWDVDEFFTYFEEIPEDNIEEKPKLEQNKYLTKDQAWNCWPDWKSSEECEKDEPKSIWKDVSELPETTSHIIAKDCLGRYSVFESNNKMILNLKDGQIVNQDIISKFCTLTDYINNTENFQKQMAEFKKEVLERLRKWEGK